MANRTTTAPSPTGALPTGQAGTQAQAGSNSQGSPIPQDKIAMRAYERWCERGCPHGTDQDDWYQAEAELRREMGRASMPSTAPQKSARR